MTVAKGDFVILVTGRGEDATAELMPSEAEAKRREKANDTAHYWLVDPESHRIRPRGQKKEPLPGWKFTGSILTDLGIE